MSSLFTSTVHGAWRPTDPEHILLRLPSAYLSISGTESTNKAWTDAEQKAEEVNPTLILDKAANLIRLGQLHSEPRFLSRARKLIQDLERHPAKQSSSPSEIKMVSGDSTRLSVLKAALLQNEHQFKAALALLNPVLRKEPNHIQARLIRAQIYLASANFRAAREDCLALVMQAAPAISALCINQVDGLTRTNASIKPLQQILDTPLPENLRQELHLSVALMAERRMDNQVADVHFREALKIQPERHFARLKYVDFLLSQQRYEEVIELLRTDHRGKTDLMIRLLNAYQGLGPDPLTSREYQNSKALERDLKTRFTTMDKKDKAHDKDYGLYLLTIVDDADKALLVARNNWHRQKEPADAIFLLRAADSAGVTSAKQTITDWYDINGIVDQRIAMLLTAEEG